MGGQGYAGTRRNFSKDVGSLDDLRGDDRWRIDYVQPTSDPGPSHR